MKERRYNHTLGTIEEARRLAKHYKADEHKAALAAALHDILKEISRDKAIAFMKKHKIRLDKITMGEPKLWHGPLSAYYARYEFGITDNQVLDAITYHTTGRGKMTMLDKIIYIADFIEPTRNFDDVAEMRKLAYDKIDKAILYGLTHVLQDIIANKKGKIHPNQVQMWNDLVLAKD